MSSVGPVSDYQHDLKVRREIKVLSSVVAAVVIETALQGSTHNFTTTRSKRSALPESYIFVLEISLASSTSQENAVQQSHCRQNE